ncbi:MAG: hypothetical protein ACK470_21840 [Pseudanabaena sp.]
MLCPYSDTGCLPTYLSCDRVFLNSAISTKLSPVARLIASSSSISSNVANRIAQYRV